MVKQVPDKKYKIHNNNSKNNPEDQGDVQCSENSYIGDSRVSGNRQVDNYVVKKGSSRLFNHLFFLDTESGL